MVYYLPIIIVYVLYLGLFDKIFKFKNYVVKGFVVFILILCLLYYPGNLVMYFTYGFDFIKNILFEHIFGRGLSDVQGKTQPFWILY